MALTEDQRLEYRARFLVRAEAAQTRRRRVADKLAELRRVRGENELETREDAQQPEAQAPAADPVAGLPAATFFWPPPQEEPEAPVSEPEAKQDDSAAAEVAEPEAQQDDSAAAPQEEV